MGALEEADEADRNHPLGGGGGGLGGGGRGGADDDDPFDALASALDDDPSLVSNATGSPPGGLPPSASTSRRVPPTAPEPSGWDRGPEPFAEARYGSSEDGGYAGDRDDVPWGERLGEEEDVDDVLGMLRREGLFEEAVGEAGAAWTPGNEIPGLGRTRTRGAFAIAWGIAIVAVAGAFFGWHRYVEGRHEEAAELRDEARGLALTGSHEALVSAERSLRLARDLDPNDTEGLEVLLFVHAQRALEDGRFEAGYLRPTLARAERSEAGGAMRQAARAVLAAAERDHPTAQSQLSAAAEAAPDDARVQYLTGRLGQRLGSSDAAGELEGAVEAEPGLIAAALALVELRADGGQVEGAKALLGEVLGRDGDHLRARVWQLLVEGPDREPGAGLADARSLEDEVSERGAATDRVLLELARTDFHLRGEDIEAAKRSVDAAAAAGASEPRLLARLAEASLRVGALAQARAAASRAVGGAPGNPDFRKLLAGVLLRNQDGVAALRVLADLSMDDPEVLRMSAQAALASRQSGAIQSAREALGSYLEASPDEEHLGLAALALRLQTAEEGGRAVLPAARRLVREHPEASLAKLVLGEALLEAGVAEGAVERLGEVVEEAPEDAEARYLLGRGQRLAGDFEAAEKSFRQAIDLAGAQLDATLALGRLLLDAGRFDEADAVYQDLASRYGERGQESATLLGRLGRVEALVGQGVFDEAHLILDQLSDAERGGASARITEAVLAIGEGDGERAKDRLDPLEEGESPSPLVLALLGDALRLNDDLDGARERYEGALAGDAGLPEALVGAAEVALAQPEPDGEAALTLAERARKELERRLRPPTLEARVLTAIGAAHLEDGRRHAADALPVLEAAAAIEDAPAETFFFLGRARDWTDAPDDRVEEAFARYLSLEPEGRFARTARRAMR